MSIVLYFVGTIMAVVALFSALVILTGVIDTIKCWGEDDKEGRMIKITAIIVSCAALVLAVCASVLAFSAA